MTAPLGKCDQCGSQYAGWALGVNGKNYCDCGGNIVLIPAHDRLIDEHPPPSFIGILSTGLDSPFLKNTTRRTYQVEIPDAEWLDFLRKVRKRKFCWGQGDDEYVSLTAYVLERDDMDTITEIEMEWE